MGNTRTRALLASITALTLASLGSPAIAGGPRVVEELAPDNARIFVDGRPIDAPIYRVWKPVCGGNFTPPSEARFAEMVEQCRDVLRLDERPPVEAPDVSRGQIPFDLVFNVIGTPPPGATTAIAAVEAYFEAEFAGDMADETVGMDISWANLGPLTLGVTTTTLGFVNYGTFVVPRLQTNMDADDVIQDWLPAGSLQVRYDGTSSTTTTVTDVLYNTPALNVCFPSVTSGGADPSIVMTTGVTWDYDPSNGVTGSFYDFQSVLVHEVLHALAFTSWADGIGSNVTQMDMFRFQRTANNPSTYAQFSTTPRTIDTAPNDDAETDLIDQAYRMADGSPNQASHFRDQAPEIGIMDPNLSNGQTFWPDFMQESDKRVLDAVGYDFVFGGAPCEGDVDDSGTVNVSDVSYVIFRLGNSGVPGTVDGDADGSGTVDVSDIGYVIFRFGACP